MGYRLRFLGGSSTTSVASTTSSLQLQGDQGTPTQVSSAAQMVLAMPGFFTCSAVGKTHTRR
jgi:hypothetical protein